MLLKQMKSGKLDVKVFSNRAEMGHSAASDVAGCIRSLLAIKDCIYIVFAAAPSQNEFLDALVREEGIDWNRIHALHMDEYVNLPPDAPQGFGNFLRKAIFDKVPFASVDYIGSGPDAQATCARYEKILRSVQVDIVCLGIGENGHIAFNDPHVADFHDEKLIKMVNLDQTCRMQQVHDGCFARIEDVPKYAVTLTIPAMVSADFMFCVVPAASKAAAVKAAVTGPVSESCPASILQTHTNAILYADADSANGII